MCILGKKQKKQFRTSLNLRLTHWFLESTATHLKSDRPKLPCEVNKRCQLSHNKKSFSMVASVFVLIGVITTKNGPCHYVRRPQITLQLFKQPWHMNHQTFTWWLKNDWWRCLNAGTVDLTVGVKGPPGASHRADRKATEEVCPPPDTTPALRRVLAAVPAPTTPSATASVGPCTCNSSILCEINQKQSNFPSAWSSCFSVASCSFPLAGVHVASFSHLKAQWGGQASAHFFYFVYLCILRGKCILMNMYAEISHRLVSIRSPWQVWRKTTKMLE